MTEKKILHRCEHGQTGEFLGYMILCPGCGHHHHFSTPSWTFNGNEESPTFSPSMLVRTGHFIPGHDGPCWCTYNAEHPEEPRRVFVCVTCHSFVTDGKIQFLADCTHELAGQTVPLQPF